MATRMRLQRHGRKKRPFYHIVIADGRAPRDGRFIERIGYYDVVKVPAEVRIDFDKALEWYKKGAQPSDTVRNILRAEGVLMRYHLLVGVEKGALTQEQADVKFNEWKSNKVDQMAKKRSEDEQKERNKRKQLLDAEKKTNEARVAKIQERNIAAMKAQEAAARKAYAEAQGEEYAEEAAEAVAEAEVIEAVAESTEEPQV